MSDTDSYAVHIETDINIYEFMYKHSDYFDLSNYPKDSPYYRNDNELLPGFFKDEMRGEVISEIVCPKLKSYAIKLDSGKEHKRLKCVSKVTRDKNLSFEHYKQTLFKTSLHRNVSHSIQSQKFEVNEVMKNHISLHSYDEKRYAKNLIETLPFGFVQDSE